MFINKFLPLTCLPLTDKKRFISLRISPCHLPYTFDNGCGIHAEFKQTIGIVWENLCQKALNI